MTMGKKAIRKAIHIFGMIPYPIHTMNRGAIAILGIACEATIGG